MKPMKKITIRYCPVSPVKKMIASRVAADLKSEDDWSVETAKGGLGELSVTVNEEKIYNSNPLWHPTPGGVIKKVRAVLGR